MWNESNSLAYISFMLNDSDSNLQNRQIFVSWENTFKGGNYSPQTKIAIKN